MRDRTLGHMRVAPDDSGAVAGGGWRVIKGGWRVIDGGWRVIKSGWTVTDGSWRVTDGGWRVTDGGGAVDSGLPEGTPRAPEEAGVMRRAVMVAVGGPSVTTEGDGDAAPTNPGARPPSPGPSGSQSGQCSSARAIPGLALVPPGPRLQCPAAHAQPSGQCIDPMGTGETLAGGTMQKECGRGGGGGGRVGLIRDPLPVQVEVR